MQHIDMTDEIDAFLIDQIKRHEGFRSKVYHCTAGKLTIGIGRNLDDVGISEDEAEYLALNDLKKAAAQLNKSFPWYYSLTTRRKQAMINLVFNLGITRLSGFKKFLAAMSSGDYKTASAELLDSQYAKQVGKRANELAAQIEAG